MMVLGRWEIIIVVLFFGVIVLTLPLKSDLYVFSNVYIKCIVHVYIGIFECVHWNSRVHCTRVH